jgi:PAS domain-containing protein
MGSDSERVNITLKSAQVEAAAKINSVLAKTLKALHLMSVVVQSDSALDYNLEFLPIMEAGAPPYVSVVMFNERVVSSNKNAFVASKRASGGLYSNFTIQTKQTNTEAVEFYPVILSHVAHAAGVPVIPGFDEDKQIAFLGNDVYDLSTKSAFAHAKKYQQPSLSESFYAETTVDADNKAEYTNATATIIFPLYNTSGELFGVFASHLSIDSLVSDTIGDSTANIIVSLYDANNTVVNGGLLYNSRSLTNNVSLVKALSRELFTVEASIPFLNKVFTLKFTSTSAYVDKNQGVSRWLGMILCAVGFVVGELLCLSLFIFFRLRKSIRDRLRKQRALHALKDSHERTKLLLSRLAKQEAKSRATVDAIPDFVIILNSAGRIVHTNKTFDKLFGYSQKQLEEGLQITTVIPALTANIFVEPKYSSDEADVYIRAVATSNTSVDMDVKCIVKNLHKTGLESSDSMHGGYSTPVTIATPLSVNDTGDEEEEAFAVIGRVAQLENIESFDLRKNK